MKAASIHEIRQELNRLPGSRLSELCLRLAKFRLDNKELLSYLLFESEDEAGYLRQVKEEMDLGFRDLPKPNLYLTKKSLRKVLRGTLKQIRYIGSAQAEVELLAYFLHKIRVSEIPFRDSPVLSNLYRQQLKKVHAAMETMHEELQYDYRKLVRELSEDGGL